MPQVNLRHQYTRSIHFRLSQQLLLNDNAREYWMAGTDASIGLRLNKSFSTELHTRAINFKSTDNTIDNRILFFHTISYRFKFAGLNFSLRNRLQQLIFAEHLNDEYRSPRWYNRVKFACNKQLNYYYNFGLNAEFFYPLNNPNRKTIDQVRYGVFGVRKFNDHFNLGLSYQIQQQLARNGNNRFYVLSIITGINI